MKKIFLFSIIWILFSSCDVNNWEDSVITNNSKFPVTFKFNNTEEKQLAAEGASVTFKTTAYQHIEYYSPDKRVYFTYEATDTEYTGKFDNRPSWSVKVNNAIGENATLSADGWMEEMKDIIPGDDDDDNHKGTIYTSNPNFSVSTSGFPAVAKYSKDDATFLVTIQRGP